MYCHAIYKATSDVLHSLDAPLCVDKGCHEYRYSNTTWVVFTERELVFTFATYRRPSVHLSSVCL